MSESGKAPGPTFSAFWPICLLAVSIGIFLAWQVREAARQYRESLRMLDQQALVAGQASQAEERLRAIMLDLIRLAETDTDAKAIVTKFGISFNPGPSLAAPGPGQPTATAPAAVPQTPPAETPAPAAP